ncbi:MAG TPA: aspartyl protease family protein [Flavobacteriaceae bacterium]|nr:aspartyl protease family protein [Flavobacteriaceae bacterium]
MSKKTNILFFTLLFALCANSVFSQSNFHFENPKEIKDKLRFEFIKGLVILPVKINGVELSFLLDTGVEKTILFSLEEKDSIDLNDAVSIDLRGLGKGGSAVAFKSDNNHMEIGKAVSTDFSLFVIFDKTMNFSPRLGIPVHGIIGYDFFKNFVVEISYDNEFIKFYDPKHYDEKCRNCDTEPLFFYNNKPYLKTEVKVADQTINITLLVDSGAGDALWLFPNEKIKVPSPNFQDFLGYGLSGSVYGKRSKISFFSFGKYEFEDITTAFPDSSSVGVVKPYLLKDGLIGAEILKRFDLIIDYPDQRLLFEPNKFFDDPFYYDLSGLILQYDGMRVVREYEQVNVKEFAEYGSNKDRRNLMASYSVKFNLRPRLVIAEIRPASPAFKAGLKKGDMILRVNGKRAHQYTLTELSNLFSSEVGKRIKIKVEREGMGTLVKKFYLEKMM